MAGLAWCTHHGGGDKGRPRGGRARGGRRDSGVETKVRTPGQPLYSQNTAATPPALQRICGYGELNARLPQPLLQQVRALRGELDAVVVLRGVLEVLGRQLPGDLATVAPDGPVSPAVQQHADHRRMLVADSSKKRGRAATASLVSPARVP